MLPRSSPQYWQQRHQIEGCDAILTMSGQALAKIAQAVTQP